MTEKKKDNVAKVFEIICNYDQVANKKYIQRKRKKNESDGAIHYSGSLT